jgi:hypothetical protein
LALFLALGVITFSKAGNYKMDEQLLAQTLKNSTEASFDEMYASDISAIEANFAKGGGKSRGGYLLRNFFCGGIALHRYYMGTNKGAMWALYFCVPVVGSVTACVDFWWVVFDGDAMSKYENNDKYIVWLD